MYRPFIRAVQYILRNRLYQFSTREPIMAFLLVIWLTLSLTAVFAVWKLPIPDMQILGPVMEEKPDVADTPLDFQQWFDKLFREIVVSKIDIKE